METERRTNKLWEENRKVQVKGKQEVNRKEATMKVKKL